jgi:hypothetical protein
VGKMRGNRDYFVGSWIGGGSIGVSGVQENGLIAVSLWLYMTALSKQMYSARIEEETGESQMEEETGKQRMTFRSNFPEIDQQ